MRVGVFCRHLTPRFGGATRLAVEIAYALQKRRHRVLLFAKNWSIREFSKLKNMEIIQMPLFTPKISWLETLNDIVRISSFFVKKLGKYNLDALIFDDMNYLASTVKKVCGTPVVLYIHFPYWASPRIRMSKTRRLSVAIAKIEKKLYSGLDIILCNSYFTRDFIKVSLGLNNVEVLHPPVDTSFFRPDLAAQKDNVVLTVGMFHPFKRQDVIIKLFEKHIKGSYRLIVAGTFLESHFKYYHRIRKLANQDSRVTILENVSDSELKKLYQIASVYCHTRRWEHFGVPIIEAMASGTPVVAMKGGGLVETVTNFETGFLADSTSEFVKRLKYLLENPAVRLEMGKRARRRAKEKFSVNVFAEKLEGYLMEIIR